MLYNKREAKERFRHYRTKSKYSIDVVIVFFDLFSEPHRLIVFLWVDIFGPASFKMVHSLAYIFGSQGIYLKLYKFV